MTLGQKFAIVNAVVQAAGSLTYYCMGDVRRGTYWLCACVITCVVTF